MGSKLGVIASSAAKGGGKGREDQFDRKELEGCSVADEEGPTLKPCVAY